jgi:hypothetical protein
MFSNTAFHLVKSILFHCIRIMCAYFVIFDFRSCSLGRIAQYRLFEVSLAMSLQVCLWEVGSSFIYSLDLVEVGVLLFLPVGVVGPCFAWRVNSHALLIEPHKMPYV